MHVEDLPIITEVDKDNGILLYCEDGKEINQLPVANFKAGVDYSIFEQEIGYTWINGEPIYQVTFDLRTYGLNNAFVDSEPAIASQFYTYAVIDVSALGIKQLIDGFGTGRIQKVNGGLIEDMYYGTSRSEPQLVHNTIHMNGDNTELIIGSEDVVSADSYIEFATVTIQYLKATYNYYQWVFDPTSRNIDINNGVEMTVVGATFVDTGFLRFDSTGAYTSLSNNAPDFTPISGVYPEFSEWTLECCLYYNFYFSPGIGYANDEYHMFTFNDISSDCYLALKCVYDPIASPNEYGYVWDWVLGYNGGIIRLNVNNPDYFISRMIKIVREQNKLSIYRSIEEDIYPNYDTDYELTLETTSPNVLYTNFLGMGRIAGVSPGDHSGGATIGSKQSLQLLASGLRFGRFN